MARQDKQVQGVHKGRSTKARAAEKVHKFEDEPWTQPTSLQAPPARDGMVQRWVRVGSMGKDDPVNAARKFREGWTPRMADTVPADFPVPKIAHGKHVGCIGIEGMLLCEMPKKLDEKRNRYYKKRRERQTQAINQDLVRTNSGIPAGRGFGPIEKAERSRPVREVNVGEE